MATLSGFDHLCFEDSYFLGFWVIDETMEFRGLCAVTPDHALYEPPLTGEQHCYLAGIIRVAAFKPLDVRAFIRPPILNDPNGALDLGGINVSAEADGYRITTEWFDMLFEAASVTVRLDPSVR